MLSYNVEELLNPIHLQFTLEEINPQAAEQANVRCMLLASQKQYSLHVNAAVCGFVAVIVLYNPFNESFEVLPCE